MRRSLPPPFDALPPAPDELLRERELASGRGGELERLGMRAFQAGFVAFAAETYRDAMRAEPSDRLRVRLAAAEIRLGMLASAVDTTADALTGESRGYAYLQRGNAFRYLGRWDDARTHLAAAQRVAEEKPTDGGADAMLALAASCALGELELDRDQPERAVPCFGRALGLSELTSADAITIAPLAGLAEAHARWRAPRKAIELAERALERARRIDDAVGAARALLSLAIATGDRTAIEMAAGEALRAPHLPLWVRSRSAWLRLTGEAADETRRNEAHDVARWAGMRPDAEMLTRGSPP